MEITGNSESVQNMEIEHNNAQTPMEITPSFPSDAQKTKLTNFYQSRLEKIPVKHHAERFVLQAKIIDLIGDHFCLEAITLSPLEEATYEFKRFGTLHGTTFITEKIAANIRTMPGDTPLKQTLCYFITNKCTHSSLYAVDGASCVCDSYKGDKPEKNIKKNQPKQIRTEPDAQQGITGRGGGRSTFPKYLLHFVAQFLACPCFVWNFTWTACYVYNIRPNTRFKNWRSFNCAHLCLGSGQNYFCITPSHLCWESHFASSMRANRICLFRIPGEFAQWPEKPGSETLVARPEYLCHKHNLHQPICLDAIDGSGHRALREELIQRMEESDLDNSENDISSVDESFEEIQKTFGIED